VLVICWGDGAQRATAASAWLAVAPPWCSLRALHCSVSSVVRLAMVCFCSCTPGHPHGLGQGQQRMGAPQRGLLLAACAAAPDHLRVRTATRCARLSRLAESPRLVVDGGPCTRPARMGGPSHRPRDSLSPTLPSLSLLSCSTPPSA
jgi:hypothetical protein